VPTAGAPHGARTACDDGKADVCLASACDGTNRAKCSITAGAAVECAAATCVDAEFTARGTCSGSGVCNQPPTEKCFPYTCDSNGCFKSCTAPEQCARGYGCSGGACVPQPYSCSPDGLSSIKDGVAVSCGAFRCGDDGRCEKTCNESANCAPGFVCDGPSKTCVRPPAESGDDGGGCAMIPRATRANAWLLALLGIALVTIRRRPRC